MAAYPLGVRLSVCWMVFARCSLSLEAVRCAPGVHRFLGRRSCGDGDTYIACGCVYLPALGWGVALQPTLFVPHTCLALVLCVQ